MKLKIESEFRIQNIHTYLQAGPRKVVAKLKIISAIDKDKFYKMKKSNPKSKKFKWKSKKPLVIWLLVFSIIGGVTAYQSFTSESAIFGWSQTDWSGGNTEESASHRDDQTGWSKYQSKDENLDTSTPGEISSRSNVQINTDSSNEDFNQGENENIKVENDAFSLDKCGDSIEDQDGNTYDTVKIGDQCWMAENLNVGEMDSPSDDDTIQKYCYGNDESNCDTGGGLYDWDEMMQYTTTEGAQGICPDGWHIPTDAEWHALENYLTNDGNTCDPSRDSRDCDPAAARMANNSVDLSWSSGDLTNHSEFGLTGFDALPVGFIHDGNGHHVLRKEVALFWTSLATGSNYAWSRNLNYSYSNVSRGDYTERGRGLSVRCLKDE